MLPWGTEPAGRFDEHVFDSGALKGNPLGDPHERPLWVYVPPGYDDEPERRYPSVYVIQGLTGQLQSVLEELPSARRLARREPLPCLAGQPLEPVEVELALLDPQLVAGRPRDEPLRPERLPQL